MEIAGIVQAGHRVASGQADDSPYRGGTIALQTPHFLALGLDIRPFFPGTLNISLAPYYFKLIEFAYSFPQVRWHPDFPAEDFSFVLCQVIFQDKSYDSLIYYPHPETKINHFQDPSILEILAPKIEGIQYCDRILLMLDPRVIEVFIPSTPLRE